MLGIQKYLLNSMAMEWASLLKDSHLPEWYLHLYPHHITVLHTLTTLITSHLVAQQLSPAALIPLCTINLWWGLLALIPMNFKALIAFLSLWSTHYKTEQLNGLCCHQQHILCLYSFSILHSLYFLSTSNDLGITAGKQTVIAKRSRIS